MADHVLVVLTNPIDGDDDAYNEWYTNQHLKEVVAIPGFVAARRFELTDSQLEGFSPSSHRYMALYEIDGDPAAAFELLTAEMESGRIVLPESINQETISPWCFAPISERVAAEKSPA